MAPACTARRGEARGWKRKQGGRGSIRCNPEHPHRPSSTNPSCTCCVLSCFVLGPFFHKFWASFPSQTDISGPHKKKENPLLSNLHAAAGAPRRTVTSCAQLLCHFLHPSSLLGRINALPGFPDPIPRLIASAPPLQFCLARLQMRLLSLTNIQHAFP